MGVLMKSRLVLLAITLLAAILLLLYINQVRPDTGTPGQVAVGEDIVEVGTPQPDTPSEAELLTTEALEKADALVAIGKAEDALRLLDELAEDPLLQDDSASSMRTLLSSRRQSVSYALAENALYLSDFDTAGEYLEQSGTREDTEYLLQSLEHAIDAVYETPFTDDSGRPTSEAVSYLWVHSVVRPYVHTDKVEMLEDFSIGRPDADLFGSAMKTYTQTGQADAYNYVFSYPGSIRDSDDGTTVVLAAGFSEDMETLITKRVHLSDLRDAVYAQQRVWTLVENEAVADSVKNGFRQRIGIELARTGNIAFADYVDDRTLLHYCAAPGCLNTGLYMYYDEDGRRYYLCEEHHTDKAE